MIPFLNFGDFLQVLGPEVEPILPPNRMAPVG
jgi:hypothetical protein